MLHLSKGIDRRKVESVHVTKSISTEQTFAVDVEDSDVLLSVLLGHVEEVAQRLRKGKFETKTVTLKFRYAISKL